MVKKTLFLGDLEAQHKIWQKDVLPILDDVQKVISLGNLLSCSWEAADKKDFGRNHALLTLWSKVVTAKIQIIGPNEIAALNFPDKWTNSHSNTTLRDEWLTETPTYHVATVDKGRLITHAGLTYGEWLSIGSPKTAEAAAERLNNKYSATLYQGPCFKLDGRPNGAANPIWADPILELYPSWILAPEASPFPQLHGGESLNTYRGREQGSNPQSILFYLDNLSFRKYGSVTEIKGVEFKAIDVGLKRRIEPSLPADKSFYVEKSS